jgi:predicted transcriptional regulator
MGKGRMVKDLSNIDTLFGKQEPEGNFAEELARHNNTPPPAMDIEQAVLELMANYRGWTVGDVQNRLKLHPDAATIPALMNKFSNAGKFDIMATTGRASMYTLKRNPVETITSARNKAAPFKLRDPEGTRQAADPMGTILVEEGVDVAIWKVMADFKPRTIADIRGILAEYRFDRKQVDRRLDTLIRNNRWFDRTGRGGSETMYVLKKHMPMPALPNSEPSYVANFNARDNAPTTETPEVPTFSGHMGYSAGEMDRNVAAVEQAVRAEADDKTEDVAPQTAAEPELPAISYIITPDDSNAQAIWKAIHDHNWYTTPDIQTLVTAGNPNLNAKSVATLLSKLHTDGLLERKPVEGKYYFNYRLKEGVPMPADNRLQHRVPKATQEALKEAVAPKAPEQSELPVETEQQAAPAVEAQQAPVQEPAAQVAAQSNQSEENEAMANAATKPLIEVVKNEAPAENVELIVMAIPLKGELFTFDELRQLVQELQALGYGRTNGAAQQLSIVSQTVRLKGIEFQKDELDTIVKKLVAEGFGKHLQSVTR